MIKNSFANFHSFPFKMLGPLSVLNNSIIPDLQLDEIMGMLIFILSAIAFGNPSYSDEEINKSQFCKRFDISYIF